MSINKVLIVCLIIICLILLFFNRFRKKLTGGSFVSYKSFEKLRKIYKNKDEYEDKVFEKFKKFDDRIFKAQLSKVNKLKSTSIKPRYFIVPDVHGSLLELFGPLIHANLIEPGSIDFIPPNNKFPGGKFTCTMNKQQLKSKTSKVVYCGDILGRGANRYNLQLLDFMLDISTKYHDSIKFIIGNHESSLINNSSPNIITGFPDGLREYKTTMDNTDYINDVRNKLKEFIIRYADSIIYFDTSYPDYNIIVSHTFIYDIKEDIIDEDYTKTGIKKLVGYKKFYKNGTINVDALHEYVVNLINKSELSTNERKREVNRIKYKIKKAKEELNQLKRDLRVLGKQYRENIEALIQSIKQGINDSSFNIDIDDDTDEKNIERTIDKINELTSKIHQLKQYKKIVNNPKKHMIKTFSVINCNSRPERIEEQNKCKLTLDGKPICKINIQDDGNKKPTKWFIGHTQVQKADRYDRNIKYDNNLTLYFLDTNSSNNSPIEIDEERVFGIETLYYYDIYKDKIYGKTKVNNEINDIFKEYKKYIGKVYENENYMISD